MAVAMIRIRHGQSFILFYYDVRLLVGLRDLVNTKNHTEKKRLLAVYSMQNRSLTPLIINLPHNLRRHIILKFSQGHLTTVVEEISVRNPLGRLKFSESSRTTPKIFGSPRTATNFGVTVCLAQSFGICMVFFT